ncbi:MAG: fumarylacetoacetate hydrolase family protein [Firmicutes bacterium]|nr:fumarylacetoacetate hydrolase family protein [Bacillota bacterium]MCL5039700.1 fumarylacetoacetate hydrolase family protein [Bacillota bacterium]
MKRVERFVRFAAGKEVLYGKLGGEGIQALEGDIFGDYRETGRQYELKDVRLLAPCQPSKAVCVGLNYRRHAAELTMAVPEEPVIFIKPSTSVIAPGDEIVYWPMVRQLDYEAELVVVIGREAHNVAEGDAEQYIFGYTVGNDVTARDLQRKDGQWTRAKGFDTFLPFGPHIARGIDVTDLRVQSFLNGELRQNGRTSDLIFPVPYLVSFISKVMTLLPGDLIMTGTPEGVGPMQVGDTIEIKVEQIGSLINKIVAPRS